MTRCHFVEGSLLQDWGKGKVSESALDSEVLDSNPATANLFYKNLLGVSTLKDRSKMEKKLYFAALPREIGLKIKLCKKLKYE